MGKIKRERKKFHISPNEEDIKESKEACQTETLPLTIRPSDSNLFAGIVIDFSKLDSKMHSDDVQCMKSYKLEKGDKNLTKENLELSWIYKLALAIATAVAAGSWWYITLASSSSWLLRNAHL